MALRIAERLTRSACFHENRCSWLENSAAGRAEAGGLRVLGSALYDGTSGVALFLAEAAHAAGRDDFRGTALGAARQALRLLPRDPAGESWGFYDGWPGVAVAGARIGRLLRDPGLVFQTRRCVEQLLVLRAPGAGDFDLVSGSAGGVLALLALAELLDLPACHVAAKALGDRLCERAARSESGLSWRSPRQRRGRNLTGYSHGTSGVAHALLELYAATGKRRYAEVATRGFEYERRWYSPRERNWPDFRIERELPTRAGQPTFFQTTWCHGAPGIALSRLRAQALTGDSRYESEAADAIGTTERAVEAALAAGNAENSLCHGLAGNADVLLCAGDIAATNVDRRGLVERAARKLAREMLAQLEPSAAGATPPSPGLMLGAAGIGHLLLRVGRPATPSLLCPGSALATLVA